MTQIEQLASMVDDSHYWGTITAPYKMSLPASRRIVVALWDKLDAPQSGFRPNRMLWVAEPHRTNGYHLHWVLRLSEFDQKLCNQYWTALLKLSKLVTGANGRCEVKQIHSTGAALYCAKYIVKGYPEQTKTRSEGVTSYNGLPMVQYHFHRNERKDLDWDLFTKGS